MCTVLAANRLWSVLVVLAGVVLALPGMAAASKSDGDLAVLGGIRVHNAPDYTRLVIDTSEELVYRLGGRGKNQFIALANLAQDTEFDLDNVNLAGSRIAALELEHKNGNRAKLALPTTQNLRAEAFHLAPVASYGHRLVVDLFVDLDGKSARRPVYAEPPAAADGKRPIIVALDPGHGGEDPGTLGAGNVREANVVLTLARQVAKRLRRDPGLRVLLVRDGDYYLRHRERKTRAREARADLFVSLHADAFKEKSVQGASVYALSSGGASSEAAAWLAAKDSRSDLIGGVASDVSLKDTDANLARVLLDLSMDAQRNASLNLADALLAELAASVELHKYTVEQASFVVLKSPDIPSVLIESGFLSNPDEARRLSDPRYQNQLADAIARGITHYVERHPPPGSLIAHRTARSRSELAQRDLVGKDGRRRHIIQPGDSLSEVAARYGVTTKALRHANSLVSDRIKIGQVLAIPLP